MSTDRETARDISYCQNCKHVHNLTALNARETNKGQFDATFLMHSTNMQIFNLIDRENTPFLQLIEFSLPLLLALNSCSATTYLPSW